MKRVVNAVIMLILLFMSAVPLSVKAEEDENAEDKICSEVDEVLGDFGTELACEDINDISFGELADVIAEKADISLKSITSVAGAVILITVLSAAMKSIVSGFTKGASDICGSVCTLTSAAVIISPVSQTFEKALEAVNLTGDFITAYIPVFAGITAASGNVITAGAYDVSMLAASELIVQLTGRWLMPILTAATVLSVAGSFFDGADLSGIVKLMKKIVTWSITAVMLLFTGFVTLKCTLAGKADGAASKTAKFMISGIVPLVGGAVSDAYATVRSSFDVIRDTAGTAGCLAVAVILLAPLVQIIIFRGVMWIGSAAAGLFDESASSKLFEAFDNALSIVQCVLVCYGMIFILCTAVIMRNTG